VICLFDIAIKVIYFPFIIIVWWYYFIRNIAFIILLVFKNNIYLYHIISTYITQNVIKYFCKYCKIEKKIDLKSKMLLCLIKFIKV